MTKTVTIELPDAIADKAEAEASETGKSFNELVSSCIVEHVGWKTIREVRSRGAHLDPDQVMKDAYEELDAYRAERDTS